MYCVQCWGKKLFSYSEAFYDDEKQAINYCSDYNKYNGYARIIQKDWIEKEQSLQEFPLKKGLPVIVNSRYHRSSQTKRFNQMLAKYADKYRK